LRDVKKIMEKHYNEFSPDKYANLLNDLDAP